jgi:hypothetical protein
LTGGRIVGGRVFRFFTGQKAARYHFVPDFEGDGFGDPTWRLIGDLEDEGYTPPFGPFIELPVQAARFRSSEAGTSGRMRVATASTVRNTPISVAAESAYLILTDAPGSFPLQLSAPFNEDRAIFLPETSDKRYVMSVEVLTEEGIGWHREILEPLDTEGPGLSDLLLFEPKGFTMPDSILAAASMMLGSTEIKSEERVELGVYWEVYGLQEDTPVLFELEVLREGGGLIDRLRRLLPGGDEEGSGRLTWTEPASGALFPRATLLGLNALSPGDYALVLRASWDGQGPIESTRTFTVR